MNSAFYLALVHHPIKNKNNGLITTSVTNLDIHDISRSCKTFGVKNYFIVTPVNKQKELVSKILGHWETERASDYNPDRQDALSVASVVETVKTAIKRIEEIEGRSPLIVSTGANYTEFNGPEKALFDRLQELDNPPCLLLFGTGWGLHSSIESLVNFKLEPILGAGVGYNHLSVRSAVAIYLDRLLGTSSSS